MAFCKKSNSDGTPPRMHRILYPAFAALVLASPLLLIAAFQVDVPEHKAWNLTPHVFRIAGG